MVFRANYIFTICGSRRDGTVLPFSRSREKKGRELKIIESARNADAQLKLQVTSEDERREMHFNGAGNKFIMSFVRYLCRATVVSYRRGWITAALVNVGVTRVQHAGRARVTPLCLLPANYIEHNAIRRPDLYFSCTRKIHLVVRHTGLSLRHNRIVPCHAAMAWALLSGAPR